MFFLNKKKAGKIFKGGYTLVELIIYAALMTLLVSVIVYVTNVILIANAAVRATRRVENSAIIASDRLIREIRAASVINVGAGNSVFDSNDGALDLTIPTTGGGTRNTRFYLSNEKIMVDDNDVVTGPVTLENVRATSLRFYMLTASTSQAVKFEFTLLGPLSTPSVSEKFYGTAVLRGSY